MKAPSCARPDRDQSSKRVVDRTHDDARADYVEALLAARPSLHAASTDTVRRLACLLWRLDAKQYRHHAGDGSISITHQELDRVFGRRKFSAFNCKHRIFIVHRFLPAHGQTRRYGLHLDILAMDERYLAKYEALTAPLTDLIKGDGTLRRTCPAAVASKDKGGNTAKVWGDTGVQRSVPVNLDLLRGARDHWAKKIRSGQLSIDDARRMQRLHKLASKLIGDAHTKVAGRGVVMIRYQEADSGRLYGCGTSMQNIDRLIRFSAMHGMYDYDIANCHFAIFKQMSLRCGFACKVIDTYLANKVTLRIELAAFVGCSVEQMKECLIALMYGASSFDEDEDAIPGILDNEAARIEGFQSHPWITKLRKEVKAGGKAILRKWPHRNRGHIVNDARKSIGRGEASNMILAHLMQGAEAVVLRAMFKAVPEPADIALLQHDGFTSRKALNALELEAAVLRDTGYFVTLEQREISAPKD